MEVNRVSKIFLLKVGFFNISGTYIVSQYSPLFCNSNRLLINIVNYPINTDNCKIEYIIGHIHRSLLKKLSTSFINSSDFFYQICLDISIFGDTLKLDYIYDCCEVIFRKLTRRSLFLKDGIVYLAKECIIDTNDH